MKGSLTLGELEGSLHLLEIRCTKCDRYGRERLTRMIERYGKEARLPDVRHRLLPIVRTRRPLSMIGAMCTIRSSYNDEDK